MGLQYIISDEDELSECSDWLAYAFPEDEVVGFMGLYSNFDISGHHGGVIKGKTSPGIVVAGFYATGLKWQQFNKEWENTILKPNGLDFLHPSSLIAGKKGTPYEHWSEEKKTRILTEAIQIIGDKVEFRISVAVKFPDFEKFFIDNPKAEPIHLSRLAFSLALVMVYERSYADKMGYKDGIHRTFEDGETANDAAIIMQSFAEIAENPDLGAVYRGNYKGIGFVPKLNNPPVQAADILANLTYKEIFRAAHEPSSGSRPEFLSLLKSVNGHSRETGYDEMKAFWETYRDDL